MIAADCADGALGSLAGIALTVLSEPIGWKLVTFPGAPGGARSSREDAFAAGSTSTVGV